MGPTLKLVKPQTKASVAKQPQKSEKPAWLEAAEPGLLTNKLVRTFLSRYSHQDWAEVVKLLVIHGIKALEAVHGAKILSLPELKRVVGEGQVAEVLKDDMPTIQIALHSLQERVAGICSGFGVGSHPGSTQPKEGSQQQQQQHRSSSGGGQAGEEAERKQCTPKQKAEPGALPAAVDCGVESAEERGEDRGGRCVSPARLGGVGAALRDEQPQCQPPQLAGWRMYPEWWGDGECAEVGRGANKSGPHEGSRPPPRLAYGGGEARPREVRGLVTDDDLVTAEYLDIPSSGYGGGGASNKVQRQAKKKQPGRSVSPAAAVVSEAKAVVTAQRDALRRRKREALVAATTRKFGNENTDFGYEYNAPNNRNDETGGPSGRGESFSFPQPMARENNVERAGLCGVEESLASNPWTSCFLADGATASVEVAVARAGLVEPSDASRRQRHSHTIDIARHPSSPSTRRPRPASTSTAAAAPPLGLSEDLWARITSHAVDPRDHAREIEAPMQFDFADDDDGSNYREPRGVMKNEQRGVGNYAHRRRVAGWVGDFGHLQHSMRPPPRTWAASEHGSGNEEVATTRRSSEGYDDHGPSELRGWEGTLAAWGEELPHEIESVVREDGGVGISAAVGGELSHRGRTRAWAGPSGGFGGADEEW